MKRLIIFTVILILPLTASSVGWFGIANSSLQQLDEDSYRLRVEVIYGGNNFLNRIGTGYTGTFNHFTLTLVGDMQYVQTLNSGHATGAYSNRGDWSSGFTSDTPQGFYSEVFGYDFNLATPLVGPLEIDYSATFYGDPVPGVTSLSSENVTFSGTVAADTIPEPTPIVLFGLGLVIVGFLLKFKR